MINLLIFLSASLRKILTAFLKYFLTRKYKSNVSKISINYSQFNFNIGDGGLHVCLGFLHSYSNTTPSTSVTHARTSFTRMISSDSNGTTQPIRPGMPRTTASDRTRHPLSRTVSADTGTSNVMSSRPSLTRRQSNINNSNSGSNNSKNLAPVKEGENI